METISNWALSLRDSNKLVVVEGKKDMLALKSIGILNVIMINQPLYKLVETISRLTNECILLTDLDFEGKRLFSYLKDNLQRHGVKIDNRYREFLYRNTKIRTIESLRNFSQ